MAALGRCEHPQCARAATQAVQVAEMTRPFHCCERHASDFRPCDAHGCEHLAQAVITIGPHRPGHRGPEHVWLCAACAERFCHAPSVTINGRRLINDRAGWLLPLPREVGRG